jgi:hypothetical protein
MAKKQKKQVDIPTQEELDIVAEAYSPKGQELEVQEFLEKRVESLKNSRKNILDGFNFDEIMKDADREYVPHNLRKKSNNTNQNDSFLETDETTGLRGSRVVNISGNADDAWRSDLSEPTLFVKVNTALSIIMQQNPQATFKAVMDKYKPTTALAKSIWQRSWDLASSKEQMQCLVLNLAKYGWAPWRTYPRIVQRKKEVLTELDVSNPENNKYELRTITDYNDVYREALDPHRTWIDDMANMTDEFSLNDWYFEMDYDKDKFDAEFKNYANWSKVKCGQPVRESTSGDLDVGTNDETKQRDDIITLGFYENRRRDLYVIRSLREKVILYFGPLPNDEGMLTLSDAQWNSRDNRTRYGIGLFEILKNDKVMYDRWDNMTTDQLTMAVNKMLFYSGPTAPGDGLLRVSPGVAKQKLPGTTIETVEVKFDTNAWEWLDKRKETMDNNTGITPTLQGEVQGKTLGEILHAKDAALKRLNIPIANICKLIEDDAYKTLSWANQIYSIPEIMEFASEEQLNDFKAETGREFDQATMDEKGKITADFPRTLDLSLTSKEDRDGELIESPDQRFFTVGTDIKKTSLKWKGRVTISAQSIIAPSQELERQRKLELFNLVSPVVQMIAQALGQNQFDAALIMAKPAVQVLESQDEKPENWLPDQIVQMIEHPELAKAAEAKAAEQQQQQQNQQDSSSPLFVPANGEPGGSPAATPSPYQNKNVPAMPTAPGAQNNNSPKVAPMAPNSVQRSINATGNTQMT